MEMKEQNGLRILVSSTGYFTNKEKDAVLESPIYLGIYDSQSNYTEITDKQKADIEEALRQKEISDNERDNRN